MISRVSAKIPRTRGLCQWAQQVSSLSVVGAGQMGTGIALVAAATAQISNVTLMDSQKQSLEQSEVFVQTWLKKEIKKGRLSETESSDAFSRIKFVDSLDAVSGSDIVIEAVKEDVDVKLELFAQLDEIVPVANSILASNTSSVSISRIAGATKNPTRVCGMHFMNPAPVTKLVELVAGIGTDPGVIQRVHALAERMGKVTSTIKDSPGFLVNRLLIPYINEAVIALNEGVASRDDIDKTMTLGTNVPMGPLRLADFIGLDTCLSIMRVLHAELGDSKYRPSSLLTNYVSAGWLGKKTRRGFYDDYQ